AIAMVVRLLARHVTDERQAAQPVLDLGERERRRLGIARGARALVLALRLAIGRDALFRLVGYLLGHGRCGIGVERNRTDIGPRMARASGPASVRVPAAGSRRVHWHQSRTRPLVDGCRIMAEAGGHRKRLRAA